MVSTFRSEHSVCKRHYPQHVCPSFPVVCLHHEKGGPNLGSKFDSELATGLSVKIYHERRLIVRKNWIRQGRHSRLSTPLSVLCPQLCTCTWTELIYCFDETCGFGPRLNCYHDSRHWPYQFCSTFTSVMWMCCFTLSAFIHRHTQTCTHACTSSRVWMMSPFFSTGCFFAHLNTYKCTVLLTSFTDRIRLCFVRYPGCW